MGVGKMEGERETWKKSHGERRETHEWKEEEE